MQQKKKSEKQRQERQKNAASKVEARLPHLPASSMQASGVLRRSRGELRPSSVNIVPILLPLARRLDHAVKELRKLNSRARVTVLRTRMNTGLAGRFGS